jgi:hypothetical protein
MILWKNTLWNIFIRPVKILSYCRSGRNKSKWHDYYYPHPKFWTTAQQAKFDRAFQKLKDLTLR